MTGKHLPRRSFLRGLGASIALPALDAMRPAFATTRSSAVPRMAFVYVPNGIDMVNWTPSTQGAAYELPRILEPLAPHREHLSVLTGLAHINGRALGDGPGDHARAASTFLTGVHPKKTAGADISLGLSVDQVAAQKIGSATRFPSLELGCEDGRLVGSCDSGYSCAYSNSISWRGTATPNPPEVNPRAVFERLFAGYDELADPALRARRQKYRKSILDFVREDTQRLNGSLGPTDRRKLDEYLAGVREIERRIEKAEREAAEMAPPPMGKPEGIPTEFHEHARLMYDLMAVAFQTDATRIITFMMGREGSGRAYREIGISDAHHPLTHHRNNQEMLEKVRRINRYHVEQFAYFIQKLKSIPEGDGTLLDNCMIVYGSGLSDGNRHAHHDLPVVLAGGGAGRLKPGRHIRYTSETPMTNLFLALLDRVGVRTDKLGDSRGQLEHLSDLG
jgi:hypothetical protein